jgi:hypothetical protein
MPNVSHSIRAFRPSRYAPADECEEELQREKLANMELYASRAEAGLPLFDAASHFVGAAVAGKRLVST